MSHVHPRRNQGSRGSCSRHASELLPAVKTTNHQAPHADSSTVKTPLAISSPPPPHSTSVLASQNSGIAMENTITPRQRCLSFLRSHCTLSRTRGEKGSSSGGIPVSRLASRMSTVW